MVRQLSQVGFEGEVYPVNPRYEEVAGLRCYPSLSELPSEVDLAVLNLAAHRIEAALHQALEVGTKAFVIFDPCMPEGDTSPTLVERLRAIAREAGVAICGGNGMGYSNFDARCFVGMWVHPERPPGSVTLIAHSGSVFMISHRDIPSFVCKLRSPIRLRAIRRSPPALHFRCVNGRPVEWSSGSPPVTAQCGGWG